MRITPETLLKIAQDTVAARVRSDRDLLSVYLTGSLLEEDPLLGGTTDIDLVFIHDETAIVPREIKRLTDEVHLDIAHHTRSDYRNTRALRLHPWMGPTIFRCRILYDPQHFMNFVQASVGGQFNLPEYVLGRAHSQAEHARQMWFSLNAVSYEAGLKEVDLYLRAIEHAANAVASLNGPPLTDRRLLQRFPDRVEAVGRPGLYHGLIGLLGAAHVEADVLRAWPKAWQSAYQAIPAEGAPPRLHPCRSAYYQRAFENILRGDRPHDVLWPLLHTWTGAVSLLPEDSPEGKAWGESLEHLGLLGPDFKQRVAGLDAFLDTVEETLEEWAREYGADFTDI